MTATARRDTHPLLARRRARFAPQPTGLEAIEEILNAVTGAMNAHGYEDADVSDVRLALWEAVLNAVKHGHKRMPGPDLRAEWELDDEIGFAMCLKWTDHFDMARVWWEVGDAGIVIRVADTGPGFDPRRLPDPTTVEHLEGPGGRGVLLMRRLMTRACYGPTGSSVTLWKCRTVGQR
jgi:serine/threonine-protein kinase RsbW